MCRPSAGINVTFRIHRHKSVWTFQTPIYLVCSWRKSNAWCVISLRTCTSRRQHRSLSDGIDEQPPQSQHQHAATEVAAEADEKLLSLSHRTYCQSEHVLDDVLFYVIMFCSTPISDMCYFSSASPSDGEQTSYSYHRHITEVRRVLWRGWFLVVIKESNRLRSRRLTH